MYDSYVNRYFYHFAMENDLPYAIVSDRYGLHFQDESLRYYNTHPSELCNDAKRRLGNLIRQKAFKRGFRTLVFYNNSPLMSKPYLEMLSYAGLRINFITRLPSL